MRIDNIHDFLRLYMRVFSYTRTAMAAEFGVSVSTIDAWLSGRRSSPKLFIYFDDVLLFGPEEKYGRFRIRPLVTIYTRYVRFAAYFQDTLNTTD